MKDRKESRRYRHRRIRRIVTGTPDRPRMALMCSNRAIYVQFIDDENGVTLASANTGAKGATNVDAAKDLGRRAAVEAREKGISRVVVDRGGFRFHGRVRAVVDGAVEEGLSIRSKEEK